jgi:hypothetical protein
MVKRVNEDNVQGYSGQKLYEIQQHTLCIFKSLYAEYQLDLSNSYQF